MIALDVALPPVVRVRELQEAARNGDPLAFLNYLDHGSLDIRNMEELRDLCFLAYLSRSRFTVEVVERSRLDQGSDDWAYSRGVSLRVTLDPWRDLDGSRRRPPTMVAPDPVRISVDVFGAGVQAFHSDHARSIPGTLDSVQFMPTDARMQEAVAEFSRDMARRFDASMLALSPLESFAPAPDRTPVAEPPAAPAPPRDSKRKLRMKRGGRDE